MFFKSKLSIFASTLFVLMSLNVHSTVVEIRTSLGTIEVNLFDILSWDLRYKLSGFLELSGLKLSVDVNLFDILFPTVRIS